VRMLRAHYEEGKYQGSGKNIILGAIVGIIVVFILLLWAIWELLEFVYHLVSGWL
jgi:hypothetical protein